MALKVPVLALALLSALASGLPAGSHAQPASSGDPFENDSASRWMPGIGITGMGLVNDRSGSVESDERGLFRGDSRAVYWSMGIDADVLSPALEFLPLAPRLYVHGGPHMNFDNEDPLVNDDNPGVPRVVRIGFRMPVVSVNNLGSATKVEARALGWSAGAGFAFDAAIGDLHFRIKPGIEWLWQKDRLRTQLSAAASVGGDPLECAPCRLLHIDTTTTEEFHSLGPSLEVEFDGARVSENVMLTVFTSIQALALLGSRTSDLSGTGTWTTNGVDSGIPDSTVTSKYKRDRWSYRFGVGIRFRWFPE